MVGDLHWIDPSSRELFDRVIERIADWPVLVLAMFHPEFQPPACDAAEAGPARPARPLPSCNSCILPGARS
jgi:hypothetical protein